ncbi:MAG: YezD family protein [Deltaproteobacteria bacterium]|nr:YezD family protein [Deltaproteobacteria bacterium]MCW5804177.1 YezD family protein [Deltaproteobacteria bacterium]
MMLQSSVMGHEADLELVRRALHGLRYGEIKIAVHDGEIVQIARTEKLRPERSPRTSTPDDD